MRNVKRRLSVFVVTMLAIALTIGQLGVLPERIAYAEGNIIPVIPEMVTNESGVGNAWKLFDEQELVGDPKGGSGGTGLRLSGQWNPTGATYPLYAYVNLGQTYDLTDIYFLDTFNGAKAVFYAGSPGNWSKLFEDNLGGYNEWRGQSASARTQYIRIELSAQTAEMAEIVLYGTPYGTADTTPPAAVADLAAGSATPASLTLTWTAPGDDGGTGTALAYDIRYSTSPITDDTSWNSATKATGEPAPALAGTGQSLKLTGLGTNTSYYFAMKTYDKVGNLSSLSNLPTGATDPDGVKLVLTPAMVMDESNTGKADKLVDEQAENQAGDPKNGSGGTQSTITTQNQWTSDTVAYPLYAYLDLEQPYKLTDIYIFDTYNGGDATFYSGSPGNWTEMFTDPLTGYMSWNKHDDDVVGTTTRYVRVKLDNRLAEMAEIVLYGTPAGSPPADTTAPADVEDLAAVSSTANSVTLTWTAPGDDGDTGTAASYDIRYSTTDITDVASWNGATPVTGVPAPGAAYTNESFTVVGLSADTTYYFALKTSDEVPNVSGLSNVAAKATTVATSGKIALSQTMATSENGRGNAGLLINQQAEAGDPRGGTGAAQLTGPEWEPGYNASDFPASAVIDLRQAYDITDIYLFDSYGTKNLTVSAGSPGNWTPLFTDPLDPGYMVWKDHHLNTAATTRYIRVTMEQQGSGIGEIVLYGLRSGPDTVAPGAVTNLAAANPTPTSVSLTWTAPGNDLDLGTAAAYDVRYSTEPITAANWASTSQAAGEPAPAAVGSSQSFTVDGLSGNTKYYFAMKTSDEAGNFSALSNVPNAKTTEPPDTVDPGAVTDLAVGGATPSSLLLTWTAPGDDGNTGRATAYDIRYSTSPINAGNFASATQLTGEPYPAPAGSSESFLVTGLSSGTPYYFALKTLDEVSHVSVISNLPSGSTSASGSDSTDPAAIPDLKLGYITSDSVLLTWTTTGDDGASGTATRYDIRYSTSPINAGNFGSATQVSNAPLPYRAGYAQAKNVTGLKPNTTYYFAIKAMDEAGRLSPLPGTPSPSAKTGSDQEGSKITLDPSMIINEANIGDATTLVDEQTTAGDPKGGTGGTPTTQWYTTYFSLYYPASFIVDLGASYDLTDIYFYDAGWGGSDVVVSAGTPFNWTTLITEPLSGNQVWAGRTVNVSTRYLQFKVGSCCLNANEIVLYGSKTGAMQLQLPPQPTVPNPLDATPMDQFIGMNAFIDDPIDKMQAAGFVREYHAWAWDADGGSNVAYPNNESHFNPSLGGNPGWNFDAFYQNLKNAGLFVFPDIHMGNSWITPSDWHHKPVPPGADTQNPASYVAHADHMFQYAARYGSVAVPDNKLKLASDQPRLSGLNTLKYFENWNEQNVDWIDRESYFNPYEYAAMSSADYDAHQGTLPNTVGIKNADPDAKLVMAGTAGLQPGYVKGMKFWSDWKRGGSFPADVINYHLCACTGSTGGISPEAYNTKQQVEDLVKYRNTYLPDKEIWITEFGYDTHPNSVQAVPAIGPNDRQEVQGQWLVRTYLALAAAGVDRAAMYMLRDVYETPDPEFWATSGLTTSKEDGWQPKKSWYYVYTLKNALAGLHYVDEQPSGNANVWIYRFADSTGTIKAYVLWSPTANNTTVNNYQLALAGSPASATLVTMANGDTDGVSSALTVSGGKVTVNVSERPIFVKVN